MILLGEIFTVSSRRKNIENKHEESIYFPNIQTDFSREANNSKRYGINIMK